MHNEANDVTAGLVVQARTIHGGIHCHQHMVADTRPRYRLDPAESEPPRRIQEQLAEHDPDALRDQLAESPSLLRVVSNYRS